MELIIALVLVVLIGAYFYSRSSKQEAQEAGVIALGEPPATVVVEGAGAVEIAPIVTEVVKTGKVLDEAGGKKPAAIKAKAPAKAKTAAKPKAPSLKVVKAKAPRKPRAPKTPK